MKKQIAFFFALFFAIRAYPQTLFFSNTSDFNVTVHMTSTERNHDGYQKTIDPIDLPAHQTARVELALTPHMIIAINSLHRNILAHIVVPCTPDSIIINPCPEHHHRNNRALLTAYSAQKIRIAWSTPSDCNYATPDSAQTTLRSIAELMNTLDGSVSE